MRTAFIKQLVEEGVLLKMGSGRATFYVRGDSKQQMIADKAISLDEISMWYRFFMLR